MSNIDKRALREAAVRAGGVKWQYMRATQHSKAYITDDKGSTVVNCSDGDVPAKCAGFIAAANPATVLALLDELDVKEEQRANWFQMAQKLGEDLDAAEKRIAELQDWNAGLAQESFTYQQRVAELDNSLCELLPGTQYMDPPDGGNVTPLEQVRRMIADYRHRIAELEAMREVFLRAKALMYQSGGAPIENSLNPIDAWLYDAERAAAGIGEGE